MKKNNVKIKENISITDKGNVVEYIVNSCFIENTRIGSGYLDYVPYFYEMAIEIAFVKYLIDGLEFDEDEDIYDAVYNDTEITELLDILKSDRDVLSILEIVKDKLEYEKQMVINNNKVIFESIVRNSDSIENKVKEILDKETKRIVAETKALRSAERLSKEQIKQLEYANNVNEQFTPEETAEITRKMADVNFDPSSIADTISQKYFESAKHKENVKSIETYKKSKKTAKNVLADSTK